MSYVGLVPASLIGLDLDALLTSASTMLAACREPDPERNPGLLLGLALGELARAGRDKLTFVADPALASFGAWAEQLIAESTGKHGVGIVPVDREPLGEPAAYGPDRAFVALAMAGSPDPSGGLLDALAAAGHPVIRLTIEDPMDLGGEFVRWEVATAIAGAILGIDPFDQPNVEEAKERTRRLLATAAVGVLEGTDVAAAAAAETGPELLWIEELGEAALAEAIRASLGPTEGRAVRRDPGLHRPYAGARRGVRAASRARPRPDLVRHDRRLRAAVPPLDRPAPQGRRSDRLVPPADRGAPA